MAQLIVITRNSNAPRQKFLLPKPNTGDSKDYNQIKVTYKRTDSLTCELCNKNFSGQSAKLRHIRSIHSILVPEPVVAPYSCNICGKSFTAKHNKTQHVKMKHSKEYKQLECNLCDKKFTVEANRRRHEAKIHGLESVPRRNFKCSICSTSFHSKPLFYDHLKVDHPDVVLKSEMLYFISQEEFLSWKCNIERETLSSFVHCEKYETASGQVNSFKCHRSGVFRSHGTGKRRCKLKGSNKIGYFCPASIRQEICNDDGGKMKVGYISTHLGHDCELERLYLPKEQKNEIARQLNLCESVMPSENSESSNETNHHQILTTSPEIITITSIPADNVATSDDPEMRHGTIRNKVNIETHDDLKEKTKSSILRLLAKVENYSDKQLKEVVEAISTIEHKMDISI